MWILQTGRQFLRSVLLHRKSCCVDQGTPQFLLESFKPEIMSALGVDRIKFYFLLCCPERKTIGEVFAFIVRAKLVFIENCWSVYQILLGHSGGDRTLAQLLLGSLKWLF